MNLIRDFIMAGRNIRTLALLFLVALVPACSVRSDDSPEWAEEDHLGQDGKYTLSSFESGSRARVHFSVYLPPGWAPDGTQTYPLIVFLHGQGGDEHYFPRNIPASELNRWIEEGLVPPFVLVAPRGADRVGTVQWYHDANVALLTSDAPDELRAFCWRSFRAGGDPGKISLHGHSRGASGGLYFALNHWGKFASVVANAFVSDYALDERQAAATLNRDSIVESGIRLRMTIGTEDSYVLNQARTGSPELHEHLNALGIPHEYEVLHGATHGFSSLWNYERPDDMKSGLYELLFHARAWADR